MSIHLPDTNVRISGDRDSDITSPVCPKKEATCCPVSISHRAQDMSPELVTIWLSSRNRQQDKYPVCPGSSRLTRTLPSLVFRLYIEHMLSKPPQATKLPDGAYAQVITHDDRSGMACTLTKEEKLLKSISPFSLVDTT